MTETHFVETHSGRAFLLGTNTHTAVCIRDIAAHLSKICRFAGACQQFYSVAQHSVLVSDACNPRSPLARLYGLLHDAHEAYLGDVPAPVKEAERMYDGEEAQRQRRIVSIAGFAKKSILEALHLHYPVPSEIVSEVAFADAQLLATERRDLMSESGLTWRPLPDPMPKRIHPWPWPKAEERFLQRYAELTALACIPNQMEARR